MSKKKQGLKLPIFLISGPILGLIMSIILYAIINFIVASSTGETSSSSNISLFQTITNVLLFLLGVGSMMSLVPCLVIGIILLNKRRNPQADEALSPHDKESRVWEDLE